MTDEELKQKIKNKEYETKLHYPTGSSQAIKEMKEALVIKEKEETEVIRKKKETYRQDENRLYQEFKKDLFSTTPNYATKQLEIVWERAYDDGHSGGYGEIMNEFQDLIYFIDEVIRGAGKK